ncbi:hypothetical protein [Endozoicomonas sp. 2B-B]
MSVYGKCVVCGVEESLNESIRLMDRQGGDVCDGCSDSWLTGEEKCEECNGHGSIYQEGDCFSCDGSGVEDFLPGYIEHKIKKGRELTPDEKRVAAEYGYAEAV